MSLIRTFLFLGATGGCGRSALAHALTAGHNCIALCRTPNKLTEVFSAKEYPNLRIIQGNAHDKNAITPLLTGVDHILFSIGGTFNFTKLTLDDPHVCERGIVILLDALKETQFSPRLTVISSTGISRHGRDYPLSILPLYKWLLRVPHDDKKKMEEALYVAAGDDKIRWTIVRPTLLSDGAHVEKPIRVGVEDPEKGWVGKKELGCFISREDTGRWIYEQVLAKDDESQVGRIFTLTW